MQLRVRWGVRLSSELDVPGHTQSLRAVMMRLLLCSGLVCLLVSGCPSAECPSGFVRSGSLCLAADDGGTADVDADTDAGAGGPCGGSCPRATPHCLVSAGSETCVVCRTATDCHSGEICAAATHTCVGCVSASDCIDPYSAICDPASHTCRGCTGDTDCASASGRPLCVSGRCVQCTIADETACGANSCDPATGLCTTTPRSTRHTCEACVADSECVSPSRCVAMNFAGAPRPGGYCLQPFGGTGCGAEQSFVTEARVSLSGAGAESYCAVQESVTTCEATLDMDTNKLCSSDADCGAAGLADGFCRANSRCAYLCTATSECPSGFGSTCTAGHCT